MNKPLFGITGTKNIHALNARNIICNGANLLHTNIKQPVFKHLSLQTNFSEYELEHHVDMHKSLPNCEYNAAELFCQIEQALLEEKPNMLTHAVEEDILSKKVIARHANGYLVSGIDNENEAQWLRDCGGVMIHILDQNAPANPSALVVEEDDFIITLSTFEPPTTACLVPLINKLVAFTLQHKEAA